MVSSHTIRGIAIKQWAASVIYFVANFHHFVKKKFKIILSQISVFTKKNPITGKKEKKLLKISITDYNVKVV